MSMAEYRWKRFKMTWLVPNWGRAGGPAFWVCMGLEWWNYNMDRRNACSCLSRFLDWWGRKPAGWLTPHLGNARRFLNFCYDLGGDMKLLDYGANHFYARTKYAELYYYTGSIDWLGRVTVTRSQWVSSSGKPENMLMWAVVNSIKDTEEPVDIPVERRELIYSGRILTEGQLLRAMEKVASHDEFCRSRMGMRENILVTMIRPRIRREFIESLHRSVLEEYFPGVSSWIDLEGKDLDRFRNMICSMSVEEARERTGL